MDNEVRTLELNNGANISAGVHQQAGITSILLKVSTHNGFGFTRYLSKREADELLMIISEARREWDAISNESEA